MRRTYPLPLQCLPEQRIRLVRIRHFHPVDLDEDEIVKFVVLHTCVQLRDDFAHRGCFACAGGAGDIDTGAGASGDGGFEVGVDGCEFCGAAGEGGGNRGDVQGCAGELEGGGGGVVGGKDAGAEGGEFQGFLDYDAGR